VSHEGRGTTVQSLDGYQIFKVAVLILKQTEKDDVSDPIIEILTPDQTSRRPANLCSAPFPQPGAPDAQFHLVDLELDRWCHIWAENTHRAVRTRSQTSFAFAFQWSTVTGSSSETLFFLS
jgi:hypothetical protein